MAGSHDEFVEVFRSDCIKAIYLCRKYRSLKALNNWLEEKNGARTTEYADLLTEITKPRSRSPITDRKAYNSIHEAKKLLYGRCYEILGNISEHSVHVPEITDETPQESLERLKADLQTFQDEAMKIVDQEKDKADETIKLVRGDCEGSPYRSKVLLHLLLLKEDIYELIDKYLLQVRAYCSSEMEKITMIEKRRYLKHPEGVEQFPEDHASCDFQKTHVIICSQLSSLEDALDSLFDAIPRNILTLQQTSKKLLLLQLADKNVELLTSIIEAKLDMCWSLKNFHKAYVVLRRYSNAPQGISRSNWDKRLEEKVKAIVDQEIRKFETMAQILRGQEQNCAGVQEAEQYVILLKKEHDAKIDDVICQVGLDERHERRVPHREVDRGSRRHYRIRRKEYDSQCSENM